MDSTTEPAKKKILIIDDEAALLYALQSNLSVAGFSVVSFTTAEEGLAYLKRDHPDLIVLDIILPRMNGFEFLRTIKKQTKTKDIPVVIISQLVDKERMDEGLGLGAKDYIAKAAYNLPALVEKITRIASSS